jgi:hypothetical protein
MRKRINVLPWFDFRSCDETETTEIGRLRKSHYLQQHNQFSVFTLPSTILVAHSRREPRRIVTQMITVARALCLATGGPQPSVQSASYNWKHNNYSAVAPAYLITKKPGNVDWACSLQKKIRNHVCGDRSYIISLTRPAPSGKISISEKITLFESKSDVVG